MFPTWLNFLKRSPRAGDRKDPIMSQPTESPAPPAAPADVARQIAQLTDAVNRLVQAQHASQPSHDPLTDIGGDIPGGQPPRAAVDVAKLSPVQQIALGLRDARPVGPVRVAVTPAPGAAPPDDATTQGAD